MPRNSNSDRRRLPKSTSEKLGKLAAGVLDGVASLTSLTITAPPMRYPHASTTEALRSDWVRIGRDMKNVVKRQNAGTEKKKA